jgi:HNH endonuclease
LWTKDSGAPGSLGLINPNPLARSNHFTVTGLDKGHADAYQIQLSDLQKPSFAFGSKEIDELKNSKKAHEIGLFEKLKGYSQRGIRRLDREEVETLLYLLNLDTFGEAGQNEVARLTRLGKVDSRPDQDVFSAKIRRAYGGKCALTDCTTAEALDAAHIKVAKGIDDNDVRNGILLRADIHALFDKGLIALTLDARRVDLSPKLSDPSYDFLRTREVSLPKAGQPSQDNVRHHRLRFRFPCS